MRAPGREFAVVKSTHMKAKLMCRECCGALPLQLIGMYSYMHAQAPPRHISPGFVCMEWGNTLVRKGVIIRGKHAKTVLLCLMCVRAPWRASRQNQRHGVTAHKAQERCLRMRLVSGTGPGGACTRLTSMADNQTGQGRL